MAIEVGEKQLTGDRIEPVDTLNLSQSQTNLAEKIITDLEDYFSAGMSNEMALEKVKEDFKLKDVEMMDIHKTLLGQMLAENNWRQKLGASFQGYTTTLKDGHQFRIPHLSLTADIDVFDKFIQFIFQKGVDIGKSDK